MSTDAKPQKAAASIAREPSNATRKSHTDPQAAEINGVQRKWAETMVFQRVFHKMQMLRKIVSQRLVLQEMLRNIHTTCGENAEKITKKKTTDWQQKSVVTKNMKIPNPNCQKRWQLKYFCVSKLWLPECLRKKIICPSLLGLKQHSPPCWWIFKPCSKKLYQVTSYYFLPKLWKLVLIIYYYFLPKLYCPIAQVRKKLPTSHGCYDNLFCETTIMRHPDLYLA